MSQIGVSVVMAVPFRGVNQEFSNVFHYSREVPTANESERDSIIDEIVSILKASHSSDVLFKRAMLWTSGGTPGQNDMLRQRTLSGVGSSAVNASMDRERAVLIRWPAGKDVRGRPVFLRKWFHVCGNYEASAFSASILQNTTPILDATRAIIASHANGLKVVGATVDTWSLCAESGRSVQGDAECHKYLEHHQLGDMWR